MSRPRRRTPNKRNNNNNQAPARDFWAGNLPADDAEVSISDDPTAVVRSLGPPPLGGRDTVAEYYFVAIYEKAAGIASALAAASGVLAADRD